VDSGQITLHVRAPAGTRIEDTTQVVAQVEREVRLSSARPDGGGGGQYRLNQSPINLLYNNSGTVGLQDADIFISLSANHSRTADYVRTLRERLPRLFPQMAFSFPPPDITSQILNFGAPAPLDVQVTGTDRDQTRPFALRILREIRKINGLVDARMQQSNDFPQLDVAADRSRMSQLGLTERDVTQCGGDRLGRTSQSAAEFLGQSKMASPTT